jgi:4a-hydroxytetrahydrobiopterin dehydratase
MKSDLSHKRCEACEGIGSALNTEQVLHLMPQLHHDWEANTSSTSLTRVFHFKNYYHTMAFVNALAWIAHQENHHPDLLVSYNKCSVTWNTHALNGLSMNDFICAAKTDALIVEKQS